MELTATQTPKEESSMKTIAKCKMVMAFCEVEQHTVFSNIPTTLWGLTFYTFI